MTCTTCCLHSQCQPTLAAPTCCVLAMPAATCVKLLCFCWDNGSYWVLSNQHSQHHFVVFLRSQRLPVLNYFLFVGITVVIRQLGSTRYILVPFIAVLFLATPLFAVPFLAVPSLDFSMVLSIKKQKNMLHPIP